MSDNPIESTWIGRVGRELDVLLNVLILDGSDGVTVSEHAAQARASGKLWGCVLCGVLAAAVQKNHCQLVLTNQPTPIGAGVRALVLILAVFVAAGLGIREVIENLF